MLKGIGIGAIIKLVLAIMVASLFISMSSIGSLGQALQQSFTDINQYTDQTTEIEDAKTLNDLTLFVRDRALNDGCTVVNNVNDGQKPFNAVRTDGDFEADGWGYPGLKGTQPLTQHPTCFGGEAGAVRDPGGLIPGSGLRDFTNFVGDTPDENFMPGIYSRQKFKVPEDLEKDAITIGGRENNGRYWLDENLVNVVPTTPEKASEAIRAAEGGTSLNDLRPGLKEAVAAGTVCRVCAAGMLGIDVGINVVDEIGNTWFDDENRKGTQIERPVIYFKDQNVDIDARTNLEAIGDEYDTDSNIDISELNLRVNLCPGDEGYVQGSRGYPDGHGHSSDEPLYPIIVVEKVEQPACEDLDIEEYSGPLSGPQLYIKHHQDQRGVSEYKKEAFELREKDDLYENEELYDLDDPSVKYAPSEDRCQAVFSREVELRNNDDDVAGFPEETVIRKQESDLHLKIPGAPDDAKVTEWTTIDQPNELRLTSFQNFDLSGGRFTEPDLAGELRPQTDSLGIDEMYGDLLCSNPDDGEFAEWHLCHEDQSADIEGWECEAETGRWVETVENPQNEDQDIEEDDLEGDVTTKPSIEVTGENPDVINKTDSSIKFGPGHSSYSTDHIAWQPLPEGEKRIELTLNFNDRGHLKIDAQRDAGDEPSELISGLNTDRNGEEHLWRFNSEDDYNTGYDYPLNSDFTVVLERSDGELVWSVREGGEEKWSFSKESQDFRRLALISWSTADAPELEIKKVEITDKE